MTHPMLEKVARAMCDGDWDAVDFCHTPSGETPEEFRDYWLGKARAAIQALLEPDEGMDQACDRQTSLYERGVGCPVDIYRAMLLPLIKGEGE